MTKNQFVEQVKALGFGFALIENADTAPNAVRLSAELFDHDQGLLVGDYYGEYCGGYPWIQPKLEELADQAGTYFEWENPAVVVAYL